MNNYESHFIYEFLHYAELHNIVIFILSLHFTHVTQSLNVKFF